MQFPIQLRVNLPGIRAEWTNHYSSFNFKILINRKKLKKCGNGWSWYYNCNVLFIVLVYVKLLTNPLPPNNHTLYDFLKLGLKRERFCECIKINAITSNDHSNRGLSLQL